MRPSEPYDELRPQVYYVTGFVSYRRHPRNRCSVEESHPKKIMYGVVWRHHRYDAITDLCMYLFTKIYLFTKKTA